MSLATVDPQIFQLVQEEAMRQEQTLELIPSENVASRAVMEAQGSVLTNKYAEGYPGKRYYGGCHIVDKVEEACQTRARELFGAEHVNVQPHSGSQANMAVYLAVLKPGDTILGMDLSHGGHLTHGSKVNFSGLLFDAHFYGVRSSDHRIDMDQVREVARKVKPKILIAGASSYPRIIDFEAFAKVAQEVGALLVVDMAHIAGLVAARLHPSPIPVSDFVTTTTHKTLRGPRGGMIFCKEAHRTKINSRIFPGIQGGPLMHVIAAKAVALRQAMGEEFQKYQRQVIHNCRSLAVALQEEGFDLVSGGTDNHLLLIDLRKQKITGKEAEHRLDAAGITVNKNTIPFDPETPMVTSGVRMGTPTVTSRGMGPEEMKFIAQATRRVMETADAEGLEKIRREVLDLCARFPLYQAP